MEKKSEKGCIPRFSIRSRGEVKEELIRVWFWGDFDFEERERERERDERMSRYIQISDRHGAFMFSFWALHYFCSLKLKLIFLKKKMKSDLIHLGHLFIFLSSFIFLIIKVFE